MIRFCLIFLLSATQLFSQTEKPTRVSLYLDFGAYFPQSNGYRRDFDRNSDFSTTFGFEIGQAPHFGFGERSGFRSTNRDQFQKYAYDQVIIRLGYCRAITLGRDIANLRLAIGPVLTSLRTSLGPTTTDGQFVRFGFFVRAGLERRVFQRLRVVGSISYDIVGKSPEDTYKSWGGANISGGLAVDIFK